jgi:hypothetical protein
MPYQLLSAEENESNLFFRLDSEASERHGVIGYMRADFGKNGRDFWTTWFDCERNLKTYTFKKEFEDVVNSLRDDGQNPPFASRSNLAAFCAENRGIELRSRGAGYKIRTLNFSYYARCLPRSGDYDIVLSAYDNRYLLPELAGKHELPEESYTVLPSTGALVLLVKGEKGHFKSEVSSGDPATNRAFVYQMNQMCDITRAQEEAMIAGSLHGFDHPAAKPWNYDQNGKPRIQLKKKDAPER